MTRTSDTRITGYEPLFSPAALLDQLPLDDPASATVERSRADELSARTQVLHNLFSD